MAELGQNSNHCQSRNIPFKLIIDRGHHKHRLFDRPVLETVSPVARQYLENSLSGTAYCADADKRKTASDWVAQIDEEVSEVNALAGSHTLRHCIALMSNMLYRRADYEEQSPVAAPKKQKAALPRANRLRPTACFRKGHCAVRLSSNDRCHHERDNRHGCQRTSQLWIPARRMRFSACVPIEQKHTRKSSGQNEQADRRG